MNLELLDRSFDNGGRPPSRRWSIVYMGATILGYMVSTYAVKIADKLAPSAPVQIDAAMTGVDDGPGSDIEQSDARAVPLGGQFAAEDNVQKCDKFEWCIREIGHELLCHDGKMRFEDDGA